MYSMSTFPLRKDQMRDLNDVLRISAPFILEVTGETDGTLEMASFRFTYPRKFICIPIREQKRTGAGVVV